MRLSTLLELAAVAIIAAAAVYAIVDSYTIAPGFGQVLGADQYPRIVATVLVALCAIYAAGLVIAAVKQRQDSGETGYIHDPQTIALFADFYKAGPRLVAIWVLFLGFLVTLNPLGYLLTSFLFLSVSIYLLGRHDNGPTWPLYAVAYAALITGTLWVVLSELLNVYLPQGRLWM